MSTNAAVSDVVVTEAPVEVPSLQVVPEVTVVGAPESPESVETVETAVAPESTEVPSTSGKKGKKGKKKSAKAKATSGKKGSKAKAPVAKKATSGKKGRPAIFVGELKSNIISLLRHHKNATRVLAILGAVSGDDANERVGAGITEPVSISMPTLLNLAHGSNVKLPRGRRKGA